MKSLFIITLLFVMTGCKFQCEAEKTLSQGISGAIASKLNCQNLGQINLDVAKFVVSTKVCEQPMLSKNKLAGPPGLGGPIGTPLCNLVVTSGVDALAGKVPASWQCDPSLATQALKAVLQSACLAVPF